MSNVAKPNSDATRTGQVTTPHAGLRPAARQLRRQGRRRALAVGRAVGRAIGRAVGRKPTTSDLDAIFMSTSPNQIPTQRGLVRQRPLTRAYAQRLANCVANGVAGCAAPAGRAIRRAVGRKPTTSDLDAIFMSNVAKPNSDATRAGQATTPHAGLRPAARQLRRQGRRRAPRPPGEPSGEPSGVSPRPATWMQSSCRTSPNQIPTQRGLVR